MGLRIEWRSRAEGDDALLTVDENTDTVLDAWEADAASLTDFLNDMAGLSAHRGRDGIDLSQRDPEQWGDLVIARSEDGDVLSIEPQLYWEGVAYWFRSRGDDPHPWRGRR
jgi:hypothetical protein